jgi:hypothetical protein
MHSYSEKLFAVRAGNPTEGQNMNERRRVPPDILDLDFWKSFEELLGAYSLKLEHFHQGTIEYRRTILDEPTDWVELHSATSEPTCKSLYALINENIGER